MPIIEQWNIKSRSHSCCESETPFADGDFFYTAIFEDPETETFIRKDYSEDAWQHVSENLDPSPFSFWRSKYERPPVEEKKPVVEKETVESLLRRLIEENEADTENARYVLTIMLERRKTLKPTDTQESEKGRFLIYEHRLTGDVFIVKDPLLRLDEIEPVQDEVALLLGAKPRAAEAPADPSDPSDPSATHNREP